MKILRYSSLLLLAICVVGCGPKIYKSSFGAYKGMTAEQLYASGKMAVQKKKYADATKRFEALNALYPFGEYAEVGQADLIYAYYMNHDLPSTIAAANRYIHLYPRGGDADFAYYMKGVANFEQNKTWLDKIYTVDPAERDLSGLRAAFVDFTSLVEQFPHSKYVPDARKRMVYIRNALASHEVEVAKFYLVRKAYVAAANRASNVVAHYEGSPQVYPALKIMVKAYHALGETKLEQQASALLQKSQR